MAVNELVVWRFLPEDIKPAVYPGRTDVPASHLSWSQTFRTYVGVPAVDANQDVMRETFARKTKLGRMSENDQVQPDPILGTPVVIDGNQPELPGAEYTLTPSTLRPKWPSLEK